MGIGALIAAPTLVWQYAHDWPQLRMAPIVAGETLALYGGRPGIAASLIVFAGLAGAVLAVYGLWRATPSKILTASTRMFINEPEQSHPLMGN